jgi:glycosyltransferase involved in cell wall biosynthesis
VADEAALVPLLAECDAFFLPLTFRAATLSRDQLATCFGIKSYEYFLAQRPIIVHTPGDYFLARFYRQRECGLVVDDPSPAALRAAFGRIREDRALRERVVRQGLVAAGSFGGPKVADSLRRVLRALQG